ncbi:MAG TPA: hypothetical protein VI819_01115 [Patescibacteria group bacterium]|nr:hypothetical protein [Patescibacteria group bacterium]
MKKILVLTFLALLVFVIYYFFFRNSQDFEVNVGNQIFPVSEFVYTKDNEKIQQILLTNLPTKIITTDRGKVFCSTKVFDSLYDKKTDLINTYIWAYCNEFFLNDTDIMKGYSYNNPALVKLSHNGDAYDIAEVIRIDNGSDRNLWIIENFPKQLSENFSFDFDFKSLNPSPEIQANNYYKGILEAYF